MNKQWQLGVWVAMGAGLLVGCGSDPAPSAAEDGPTPAPGGPGIKISQSVRDNLSMTFAEVVRRPVRGTLRVPGEFEVRPEGRREYRAMLAGRVELLVDQFQQVEKGTPLYRIDSVAWSTLVHELEEAELLIRSAKAKVRVADEAIKQNTKAIEILEKRLGQLKAAGARSADMENELALLKSRRASLDAQLDAEKIGVEEAFHHQEKQVATLATIKGVSVAELEQQVDGKPRWKSVKTVEVQAAGPGIVSKLDVTQGGWAQEGDLVVSIVDPTALRFHAHAPQSDMIRVRSGMPARVVPAGGDGLSPAEGVGGKVVVGFAAHPKQRSVPLRMALKKPPHWAKPGVKAYLEVFVEGDVNPELAIPSAAVVRDGLDLVFFRRDRKNPDIALRVKADLGVDDGRWVEVLSGVTDGDEIVVDGAYALMLAGAKTKAPPGYHYHADGSLHKDH